MVDKMVLVHIVLFKFKPDVPPSHRETFAAELQKLKHLPSVLDERLIVGGPSVTEPIERSRGYHLALVSYHRDRDALAEYQASKEHHEYLWPFKEEVTRFDFEADGQDGFFKAWM